MQALNDFLAKKAQHLKDHPVVVMGNESADLDSICCCIFYAFIEFHIHNLHTVPIINVPRNEFIFRAENVWLFETLGLKVDLLTFNDEIDLKALKETGTARLFLVDHNKLCPKQEHLGAIVAATIDHHVDDKLYLDTCKHHRDIRLVGSAASLVSELALDSPAFAPYLNKEVATLGLAPILVDTVNLDPAHHKVTPIDEAVARRLLAVIAGPDPGAQEEERERLFKALMAEKYNTSRLTVEDSLRKDFKAFDCGGRPLGISSILDSATDIMKKDPEHFFDVCDKFAAEKKIINLLVMCAYYVGEDFFRELILVHPASADPGQAGPLLEAVAAGLEANAPELQLSPMPCPMGPVPAKAAARFWKMGNTAYSRKKLSPLIESLFK